MSELRRSLLRPWADEDVCIREDAEDGDSSSGPASPDSFPSTFTTRAASSSYPSHRISWHDCFEQDLFLDGQHIYLTPPRIPSKDPLFICHHGAGSCGLSFALFARDIVHNLPGAGVLAVDARGHGLSSDKHPMDFSLETLSRDLLRVLHLTQENQSWPCLPTLILIGHSLGGAVVTRVAQQNTQSLTIAGVVVIDVVEGSALELVQTMHTYFKTRPKSFPSLKSAIDWHVRSRTIRNRASANLSVPSTLRCLQSAEWVWRTDLVSTEQYWQEWFTGMSASFLSSTAAKLLILAGTDRLDKQLTIGQMQGKFQLLIFPETGHFVQEDSPGKVADKIAEFWRRNDRDSLVLPPKVGATLMKNLNV